MDTNLETTQRDIVKSIILYFITLTVFILSSVFYYNSSVDNISALILLIFSLYTSLITIKKHDPTPYKSINIGKWSFLALAITLVFSLTLVEYYSFFSLQLSFFLLIMSIISYFGGQKILFKLIIPFAVLLLLIPFYNDFYSILAYPIRLVCTKLTVAILSFLGTNIYSESTIISIGEKKVAITAACSGLVLLETLTWIGWMIARYLYKSFYLRLFHFSLILPIVIFTNTLRLIALVLLYSVFGEMIIVSPIHLWLGYVMIVLASILFYFSKSLFEVTDENSS